MASYCKSIRRFSTLYTACKMSDASLGAASRLLAAAALSHPDGDTVTLLQTALRMAEDDAKGASPRSPRPVSPVPKLKPPASNLFQRATATIIQQQRVIAPMRSSVPALARQSSGSRPHCPNHKEHRWVLNLATEEKVCEHCRMTLDEYNAGDEIESDGDGGRAFDF